MTPENDNLEFTIVSPAEHSSGRTVRDHYNPQISGAPKAGPSAPVSLGNLIYNRLLLEDELEENGGELTEDQELLWDELDADIKTKVDAYGYVLKKAEKEVDTIKIALDQIGREYKQKMEYRTNRIDRIKKRLRSYMDAMKVSVLEGNIHYLKAFDYKSTSVDREFLPPEYQLETIEFNVKALRDFLTKKKISYKTFLASTGGVVKSEGRLPIKELLQKDKDGNVVFMTDQDGNQILKKGQPIPKTHEAVNVYLDPSVQLK